MRDKYNRSKRSYRYGVKNGLEEKAGDTLKAGGMDPDAIYESTKIKYIRPQSNHTYTPDWPLPNGVIVETKGLFELADRKKHLLIKAQHPDLDIRFVFSNSATKIGKKSKTSYGDWCTKNDFRFADKTIPKDWLE